MSALAMGCAEEPASARIDASPLLSPLVTEYRARHPRDTIVLMTELAGGNALVGITTGLADVAALTQELNDTELRALGLSRHAIGRTALVFGVNPAVPVDGVTRQQLCDIYSGAIVSWRQLGGPDLPIKAGIPMPRDGDGGHPIAAVNCASGFRYGAHVQMIDPPAYMGDAIATTPGGIGLTAPGVVSQYSGRIKPLAVDGVAPTPENIASGKYFLSRTTWLVTRGKPPSIVTRLLRFIRSREGQQIIRDNGAVPLN
jgi:phosphate transport system substrate-binding protein